MQNLLETHRDVLGNLTLSATNSQLGNKSLAKKQAIYKDDTLKLNEGLLTVDRWDVARINQRSQELILKAAKAFTPPLAKHEIASLGFFDSSKDALIEDVNEDSDEEPTV
ncbi:HNH endonuclease [Curtobacterium sp. 24E2]|nr:HNH endonuclease [Curtobacterium sp. 24E2]